MAHAAMSGVCSSPSAKVTSIAQLSAFAWDEAAKHVPVSLEATVTYCNAPGVEVFIQDNGIGVYVNPGAAVALQPGDVVQVDGETEAGYRTWIGHAHVTVLHHGPVLTPVAATLEEMLRGAHDAQRVRTRGTIRAANVRTEPGLPAYRETLLELVSNAGAVVVKVDAVDPALEQTLLDSEVEVTGTEAGLFDGKMQMVGVLVHSAKFADIRVLRPARQQPWERPVTPMEDVLRATHVDDQTQRVRVRGTVTYDVPGQMVVLQDGKRSLWVETAEESPLHLGRIAEAIGFPAARNGFLTLGHSQVRETQETAPVQPREVTWKQAGAGTNAFDLVSLEGKLVTQVREATRDVYVIDAGGHLLSAILAHGETDQKPTAEQQLSPGSRVRVTGICYIDDPEHFGRIVPFEVLLRSRADVALLAGAPFMNETHLIELAALLGLAVFIFGGWVRTLNRRVGQQTRILAANIQREAALGRKMAQLQSRRSRILEAVQGNQPLDWILQEITSLVASHQKGVTCWFEHADGTTVGRESARRQEARIMERVSISRSGDLLGRLIAGTIGSNSNDTALKEALDLGAQLATIAIENRTLYENLRHRSEYDLLTDVPNRFLLETRLTELLEQAVEDEKRFGLVFMDLDDFKQVNDQHGHRTGDFFLQKAAARMKAQLRNGDMLARMGGDEFAAVISPIAGREGAEEVASRLQRCFDHPFSLEGLILSGSVSMGIAVYPEDGSTVEDLQRVADAAMYAQKNARHAGR